MDQAARQKAAFRIRREYERCIKVRRNKAASQNRSSETCGLALSGGGIRSATFCLGVIRGLARNGLLKEFDYLSSVSGGGYLGASFGRLYDGEHHSKTIERRVAASDSMWLWWLRNNGRYLTPSGTRDIGFAAASILRGMISTHLELGVLILLLCGIVLTPHLLVVTIRPFLEGLGWPIKWIELAPSAWIWLMLIPVAYGILQMTMYWYTGRNRAKNPDVLTIERLKRTQHLSNALWIWTAFAGLTLLEQGAWALSEAAWSGEAAKRFYAALGSLAAVTGSARWLLPRLKRWLVRTQQSGIKIERLLNIIGIGLAATIALIWTTLLTAITYQGTPRRDYWHVAASELIDSGALHACLTVLFACLTYAIITRSNFNLLNLASLHNYYRARIERAYVSSGNRDRYNGSALAVATPNAIAHISPLTEAIKGDDVEIRHYEPHEAGGPIHLINCCINQSVDDRTGLYNADRKGVALTVSSLGVEIGTRMPIKPSGSLGTLSKWIAISGAAAGSGMGSRTTPGLAALLFMSGIRLGFWTPRLRPSPPTIQDRKPSIWDGLLRQFPKPLAIVAESLARFPGLGSPVWYVSDGGHFDNTGIYALLKREVSVIVAADCGADPAYEFADMESLVRKATIDYRATITFVDVDVRHPPRRGSLSTSANPRQLSYPLIIARIRYESGKVGTLIVVKPRVIDGMPLHLQAYAERTPSFPQQTTGDQFFDEAQWESYHELGAQMGRLLTTRVIRRAQRIVARASCD